MNKFYLYILLLVMTFIFILGCKKADNPTMTDTETISAIDYTIMQEEFSQMVYTFHRLILNTKSVPQYKTSPSLMSIQGFCDTLNYVSGDTLWNSPSHQNPVYEYNFNQCNNSSADNMIRKGSIKVTFRNGGIKNNNAVFHIDLINYQTYYYSFKADSIIIFNGGNNNGTYTYTVYVYNGFCTAGGGIQYNSISTINIQTQNTVDFNDDIVLVLLGTATGQNREKRKYTAAMANLVKPISCLHITSGIAEIKPDKLFLRTLNYGNGICDDKATLTILNNTYLINFN